MGWRLGGPARPASERQRRAVPPCTCQLHSLPSAPPRRHRSGRLFNQIRSREGLAYAVSGGWSNTPIDHPGLFLATAETAQPAALLAALRGALGEAAAAAPSAEEVQRAKQVGAGGLLAAEHTAMPPATGCASPCCLPHPRLPPCCAPSAPQPQETLNSFVFNFASRPAQLSRIAVFDLLGIPQDYLFR